MVIILVSENESGVFKQLGDCFESVDDAVTHAKDIESQYLAVSVEETTETGAMVHYQSGGV